MFEAYEVAIKLRLVDHFSSVMGMVTNRLVLANGHAEKLQKNLEGVGRLFRAGLVTTGAGFGMVMALKASTNEAVRYEQQLNRLKALNLDNRFGAGTTKGLEQKALEIAKLTKGTSNTDAVRLVTETQAITGNVAHTLEIAPVLAKLRFGMETYMAGAGKGEGHGDAAEKQFRDIVKVMEMRGMMRDFTSEKLDKMADLFVKNFVASGGMVKPSDFLAMMKTGGVAAKTVSDDFMFALGHIMQEKGGSRSGTALMSGFQNLVAGRMPQQIAETLMALGLLRKDAIHYGKTGHITKVDAGGLKDYKLFQERPDLYMMQKILPALAKKYKIDPKDQNAVVMRLNALAGQRTAADLLAQLYMEQGQIANYIEQAKNSMGNNELYSQGEDATIGQQNDLRAQVEKLEQTFGDAALPLLKSALEQTIPLVKEFGEWLKAHPEGLKNLVTSVAALGVAMMVSGPLMVVGSGLKLVSIGAGLLSGPLGSLSVALAMRGAGGAAGLATLAGNLGTVGGQLGMLTKAAGVFMVAYASWKFGGFISDKIDDSIKESGAKHENSLLLNSLDTYFGTIDRLFGLNKDAIPKIIPLTDAAKKARGLHGHQFGSKAPVMNPPITMPQAPAPWYPFGSKAPTQIPDNAKKYATQPPVAPQAPKAPIASDPGKDSTQEIIDKAINKATGNQASDTHVHLHIDSREIADILLPSTSRGTSGVNPTASRMTGGMSSFGLA